MPVSRQWSSTACCSSRVIVQPVGLFGALTISSFVFGVTAARNAGRSSVHCPFTGTSDTVRTCAPMIAGCAVRLGHTGVTATTSSPASTSACTASISALTPPEVTAMREASTVGCRRLV
ncbi:hypothetical protein D3C72_1952910 [compost metagenome]